MKLIVFGAGAWGTALAIHAAQKHSVALWARNPQDAARLETDRCNHKYLPNRSFPEPMVIFDDIGDTIEWGGTDALWVSGTSVAGLRDLATLLSNHTTLNRNKPAGFLWLCKGVEQGSQLLPHEVVGQAWPALRNAGALSGPSFADEVAAGLPCALTVATQSDALIQLATQAFHHTQMRIYGSSDMIGVALGGALKNVIAIATGVCDGLELGLNARAALITRGLAEIARLGSAMGAQPETFMGLAGLGDLVLTCTGNLSRNRKVGLALAQGQSLAQVLASLGHVAEGVACASAAAVLAAERGVEMPILTAVNAVINGQLDARSAIAALVSRKPKAEVQ